MHGLQIVDGVQPLRIRGILRLAERNTMIGFPRGIERLVAERTPEIVSHGHTLQHERCHPFT